ncbi:hypothetical protein F4604DRAFT_1686249 [Suillus subluteus]|nr:hypothetical protein F4604DRAFT_1686249 [Suillus subluteus]
MAEGLLERSWSIAMQDMLLLCKLNLKGVTLKIFKWQAPQVTVTPPLISQSPLVDRETSSSVHDNQVPPPVGTQLDPYYIGTWSRVKANGEKEMKNKIEQLKAKLAGPTASLTRQFVNMFMSAGPPPVYRPRAPVQAQTILQQIYQQPVQPTFQPVLPRLSLPQQPTAPIPPSYTPIPVQIPSQPFNPGNPFTATGAVPCTNLFYRYQQPQTPSPSHINIGERMKIAAQYAGLPHQPDTEVGRAAHAQQVKSGMRNTVQMPCPIQDIHTP